MSTTTSHTYLFQSPIGLLKLCATTDHITGLSLLQEKVTPAEMLQFKSHPDLLYEGYTQLQEYFSGLRKQFDLPLFCKGTVFQQQVWQALREIPYGETRSYEDVAISIGNSNKARAVGQANHKNPLLIINPCHRVIRKNGNITGFSYGMEVKKFLLDLETGLNPNPIPYASYQA